jgi:hypothetical protein
MYFFNLGTTKYYCNINCRSKTMQKTNVKDNVGNRVKKDSVVAKTLRQERYLSSKLFKLYLQILCKETGNKSFTYDEAHN